MEWLNGLMEQWMDKLEKQMGALSNLVIQLLERDLVLQPRTQAECSRCTKGSRKGSRKGEGKGERTGRKRR